MAELTMRVVGNIVGRLTLVAIRLPNSRSLGLVRASWIRDAGNKIIPELRLNMVLLGEAFVQLLATGLGTLALLWATVVLLGGFSTMLIRTDFWFITAIVFIETAGVVGYNTQPASKFFVDVPAAFYELGNLGVKRISNIVGLLTMGPVLITATPIFAASGCITLSIMRLVSIARHEYGGSDADASRGNVKPALILFYALVLTQGTTFFLWLDLVIERQYRVMLVKDKLNLGGTESELIDRYAKSILDTCIDKGVSSTVTRNLVSFAADLLQSEYPADHISAVTLLHALILQEERVSGALEQIQSSQQFVDQLVQLLRSNSSVNGKAKEYTAEIVAKLASHLRLADIPGSANSISSLLDATFVNIQTQIDVVDDCQTKAKKGYEGPRPLAVVVKATNARKKYFNKPPIYHDLMNEINRCRKPLIVHGLLILTELACDPDNCTEMSNTTGLVPKIIAPISHGLHTTTGNDVTSIEIVKASLGVVAKLVSGGGEASRVALQEISCKSRTSDNIIWILKNSNDAEMKIPAVQILAKLALDETSMCEFIFLLQRLFIDPPESSLGLEAGQALTALVKDHRNYEMIIGEQVGTEYPVIQQLVRVMRRGFFETVMGPDENTKDEYRAVAAELLAQICTNSRTEEDRNRLAPIASALSTVLKAIVDMEITMQLLASENPQDDEHSEECSLVNVVIHQLRNRCTGHRKDVQNQPSSLHHGAELRGRKFLASFLGLAMDICNKFMITADAFDAGVAGIPLQIDGFVKTLKGIVQKTPKYPQVVDCLLIIKNTTELATWMMQHNPIYIQYFRQEDILGELKNTATTMLALERYMILSGRTDEAKNYETLSALLGKVEALIPPLEQT